jgi:hypothetical protein
LGNQQENSMKKKQLAFALAGEIVTSSKQATQILIDAMCSGKQWLIPQAESVHRQLVAAGQ